MFFQRWRTDRQEQRKAQQYVSHLGSEPSGDDVAWLAAAATRGDDDHARWELRYARAAIGLIVAQRDALDDRTASVVGRAWSEHFAADERIDRDRLDLAERQFNARLSAYRDALGARAPDPSERLGQTLLAFAGGSFRGADEQVARAGRILVDYEREANDALRSVFGAAVLPENIPPSALAGTSGTAETGTGKRSAR
jgi:hypothetical protein